MPLLSHWSTNAWGSVPLLSHWVSVWCPVALASESREATMSYRRRMRDLGMEADSDDPDSSDSDNAAQIRPWKQLSTQAVAAVDNRNTASPKLQQVRSWQNFQGAIGTASGSLNNQKMLASSSSQVRSWESFQGAIGTAAPGLEGNGAVAVVPPSPRHPHNQHSHDQHNHPAKTNAWGDSDDPLDRPHAASSSSSVAAAPVEAAVYGQSLLRTAKRRGRRRRRRTSQPHAPLRRRNTHHSDGRRRCCGCGHGYCAAGPGPFVVGTAPECARWVVESRSCLLMFVDAMLRGIGQTYVSNNPWTGLVYLVAITYGEVPLGAMALLGTAMATATAVWAGLDQGAISSGLFGYNGCLTGIALAIFHWPAPSSESVIAGTTDSRFGLWWPELHDYQYLVILPALLMSALSTLLTASVGAALIKNFNLVPLTLPFQVITWTWLLVAQGSATIPLGVRCPTPALTAGYPVAPANITLPE